MSGRLRDDVKYSAIDKEQKEDEEERSSYYGGPSVPFIWESRPGTPKYNHFSDYSLPPPLTPPPSYYGILSTPKRQSKVRTKLTRIMSMSLFHDLRKSVNTSKNTTNNVSGSSFSWSSSSSFSSSPSHTLRKPVSRDKKSPFLYANYNEYELRSSPTSTICYSNGGRKVFTFSMKSMKRAMFSVPKHGSTGKPLTIGDMNKA